MTAKRVIIFILVAALAAAGIFFGYRYLEDQKVRGYSDNISAGLTVEAGSGGVQAEEYLIDSSLGMSVGFLNLDVDFNTPGTYQVTLLCDGYAFERTLDVVDTTAPVAQTRNVSFFIEPEPQPADFVTGIQDVSDVEVAFKTAPDLTVSGDQAVDLILTDAYGNTAEVSAVLTVFLDTQVPVITGVSDILIYAGDAVSYRSGIEVSDDMDEAPVLNVDSSQVDLSVPGTYTVYYTAVDASGNTAAAEAVVTVKEKLPDYADLETIYAKADELLSTIVNDSMTKREQVVAIYRWMTSHLGYSGHSDKLDWLQGAYYAMVNRTGDCFNYFSLSKLFLERLGIDNIDVVKVKNYDNDSSHYWSLVSLDDGETWYHFDTTPRQGEGDYFCLVTDAVMDAYSAAHNNCFNRDKSLYPATPEE